MDQPCLKKPAAMAFTSSNLLQVFSLPPRLHPAHRTSCVAEAPKRALQSQSLVLTGRRQSLLTLTSLVTLTARDLSAKAEDIPLFGLRKKLKKVEEEAEEILKEGFETAEKGIETAEKGIVAAERGIEAVERGIVAAEKEIGTVVFFGDLAQAGVVAGAEIVAVLVAISVVNGILGPEGQKS